MVGPDGTATLAQALARQGGQQPWLRVEEDDAHREGTAGWTGRSLRRLRDRGRGEEKQHGGRPFQSHPFRLKYAMGSTAEATISTSAAG